MTNIETKTQSQAVEQNPADHLPMRFIRLPEVREMTGVRNSTIYRLMAEGKFPKNIALVPGGRATAWLYSEIVEWMQQRVTSRDAPVQKKHKRRATAE